MPIEPDGPPIPAAIQSLMSTCAMSPSEGNQLSLQEVNVITYIAGYIARKIKDKVCNSCIEKICLDTSLNDVHGCNYDFVKAKNYCDAKHGLIVPSSVLSDVLQQLEMKYCSIIDDAIYVEKVKASLVSTLLKVDACKKLACDSCDLVSMVVHLMVNIYLHHTIRQTNIKLRDQKQRKNRKILKFSHV